MRIGRTVAVLCVASSFPTFLNGCDKKEKDKQDKSENTKAAKSAEKSKQKNKEPASPVKKTSTIVKDKSENTKAAKSAEKSKQKNKEPASPAKKTSTIAVKKVHSLETDHHPEGISSSSTRLERQTGGEEDELGSATLDNKGVVEVSDIIECRESLQEVTSRFEGDVESLEDMKKLEEKVIEAKQKIEGLCLEHSNVDEVKRFKNQSLSILDHIVDIAKGRKELENIRQNFSREYGELFRKLSGSQSELKDAPQRFNQLGEKFVRASDSIVNKQNSAELNMERAQLTKLIEQASNQWNTFLETSGEIWRIGTKAIDDIRSKPAQADATQQRVDKIAQTAIASIRNIIGRYKLSLSGWENLIQSIETAKKGVIEKSIASPFVPSTANWDTFRESAVNAARKIILTDIFTAPSELELKENLRNLETICHLALNKLNEVPETTTRKRADMKSKLESTLNLYKQVGENVGRLLIRASSEFDSKKTEKEFSDLIQKINANIKTEFKKLNDQELINRAIQRVDELADSAKNKRNSAPPQNRGSASSHAPAAIAEIQGKVNKAVSDFEKNVKQTSNIDDEIKSINTKIQDLFKGKSIPEEEQKRILDQAKAKLGEIATAHLAPTEVHAELNQVEYPAAPAAVEAVKDKVIKDISTQHPSLHIDTKIVQDLIDTEVKKAETCVTELKKGTYNQQIFSLLYPEVEKEQTTN